MPKQPLTLTFVVTNPDLMKQLAAKDRDVVVFYSDDADERGISYWAHLYCKDASIVEKVWDALRLYKPIGVQPPEPDFAWNDTSSELIRKLEHYFEVDVSWMI
ncbi:MAG TPA: hypothetical protein VLI92_03595 [Candidatus Saccharimonadales bacterium]|nr:hypothetical protein [Candidatus Saccharimonadales bacterium]